MSVLGPSFQVQTRSTIWMFNHDQHGRQHEVQHLNFGLGSFLGCHVGVYDRCAFIVRETRSVSIFLGMPTWKTSAMALPQDIVLHNPAELNQSDKVLPMHSKGPPLTVIVQKSLEWSAGSLAETAGRTRTNDAHR